MEPAEYNITIWKGRDWYRTLSLKDPDTDEPIDLSAHTIRAQIRTRQRRGSTLIAEFTVTATDLENGQFKLSIDDATTGAIDHDEGYWDLLITNPSGDDDPYLFGTVTVRGSVTQKS